MTQLNMEHIFVENVIYSKSYILNNIHEKQLSLFKELWGNELDRVNRPNGSQSKLRTYVGFLSKRLVLKLMYLVTSQNHIEARWQNSDAVSPQ